MSIDGSDAHPIYRPAPEPDCALDAEACAALAGDHRDWTSAGHLPDIWIVALTELSPGTTYGIWLNGVQVSFTVAAITVDPSVMCAALRQLRRIVADTPTAQPDVPTIDRRLPRQIGSARWHTPCGDITILQPGQARHRKPARRRFTAFGAPLAAVWALLHGLRSSAAPLGAAAGIAVAALVPAVPSPAPTPAHPVPGQTREEFVPARSVPAAASGPRMRSPQPPRHTRMVAPAPSAAATSTVPDPADSPRRTVIALPSVTVTSPAAAPTPTASTTAPSTPKVKAPHPLKAVQRVVHRVCVAVQMPLLGKKATACRR